MAFLEQRRDDIGAVAVRDHADQPALLSRAVDDRQDTILRPVDRAAAPGAGDQEAEKVEAAIFDRLNLDTFQLGKDLLRAFVPAGMRPDAVNE